MKDWDLELIVLIGNLHSTNDIKVYQGMNGDHFYTRRLPRIIDDFA